jgi:hypothetical protein
LRPEQAGFPAVIIDKMIADGTAVEKNGRGSAKICSCRRHRPVVRRRKLVEEDSQMKRTLIGAAALAAIACSAGLGAAQDLVRVYTPESVPYIGTTTNFGYGVTPVYRAANYAPVAAVPTTTYYAPAAPSGCCGGGAPAATTSYYAPAATTSYYAPAATTSYYAPAATTTYYAPEATTSYYAPAVVPTTTYYAPAVATTAYYAPTYTSYYAPTAAVVPYTSYYAPAAYAPAYYGRAYYYAPAPLVPGQPIRNAFRARTW